MKEKSFEGTTRVEAEQRAADWIKSQRGIRIATGNGTVTKPPGTVPSQNHLEPHALPIVDDRRRIRPGLKLGYRLVRQSPITRRRAAEGKPAQQDARGIAADHDKPDLACRRAGALEGPRRCLPPRCWRWRACRDFDRRAGLPGTVKRTRLMARAADRAPGARGHG